MGSERRMVERSFKRGATGWVQALARADSTIRASLENFELSSIGSLACNSALNGRILTPPLSRWAQIISMPIDVNQVRGR